MSSIPAISIIAAIIVVVSALIFVIEFSVFRTLFARGKIAREIPKWLVSFGYTFCSIASFVFGVMVVATYSWGMQVMWFMFCVIMFVAAIIMVIHDVRLLDEDREKIMKISRR
jgi:cyanate permease